MKKDILFMCQFFYPEYNSSATLSTDTAKYLAAHGYTVDAMAGYPKEYSNAGKVPMTETVDGVNIRRFNYIELDRKKKISRLINYFSFSLAALFRVRWLKKYRCVVVYSNPPVLPIVPIIAKKLYGTEFVFVAYDVYPEVAFASKTLNPGSLISRVMNRINHHLYQNAACVVSLTDEMKEFLLSIRKELSADRVETIANWAHEKELSPDREAYERFGYPEGQFVVSYFGNMGTCQDVETMLGAAQMLRDNDKIQFLIVGHGNKKAYVERAASDLKNVRVYDFLTGKDFEQAVSISSCCIVSLEKGLIGTCAPSKYYSYLQGGQPIIAVVEKESYLAKEVEKEKIGSVVEVGDAEGLRDAILMMESRPELCTEMGERAKALYIKEYDIEVALEKYAKLLGGIIRGDAE